MRESVSLEDVLKARDRRAEGQDALLQKGFPVVSFSLNIPGPEKVTVLTEYAFYEGVRQAEKILNTWNEKILIFEKTGGESMYSVNRDALELKKKLCDLEENHPFGRLFDFDVISPTKVKIKRTEVGFKSRKCLLCDEEAFVCARSRRHSVEEMTGKIEQMIGNAKPSLMAEAIGETAVKALKMEAQTTPKPGLVDREHSGSHPDMSLELLYCSAEILKPYFISCAETGWKMEKEPDIFPIIQQAGINAENVMLRATKGVNTHKGAIFSLGILCAAVAKRMRAGDASADTVCDTAKKICKQYVEAYFANLREAKTSGEKFFLDYHVRGIRGEAAEGFSSVLTFALPFFRPEDSLSTIRKKGVQALIQLLANTQDTTLLHRGDMNLSQQTRVMAGMIARSGYNETEIRRLDRWMVERNLTCGGCADLLACSYFLHLTAGNPVFPLLPDE